jgi:phenylalanine-4-hydroxylase
VPKPIPFHLKKYISQQDYSRYTAKDQAIWRYIMRQLKFFLKEHAHSCYVEGLKKTGISTEYIPKIKEMDKKLRRFGWGAIPVSGFIPPAAFMEFQSLGYLPIATELRTVEHIHYTPAPDIVHEAAGHAPIVIDKKFSDYLKAYAEVAAKAIISHEDLAIYEAIRNLSDAKERVDTTSEQVKALEEKLMGATERMSTVSEAGLLARMNWWTAEYGLIGKIDNPKIYGAGLLSSIGEARECLKDHVKKIPMSVNCIEYTYDITEPQPQLFVTPGFTELKKSLQDLAKRMAFKRGGKFGLERAIEAKTINTVMLDTGVQASGKVSEFIEQNNEPIFFKISGPTQIAYDNKEILRQGTSYHKDGFSAPVGDYTIKSKLKLKTQIQITYKSGITVSGTLRKIYKKRGKPILLTLKPCKVQYGEQVLFAPEWGPYDLALGKKVVSVFGGPADKKKYPIHEDFKAAKIPAKVYTQEQKDIFNAYKEVRSLRKIKKSNSKLDKLVAEYSQRWAKHWLLGLEIYELCLKFKNKELAESVKNTARTHCPPEYLKFLEDGIQIAKEVL